LRAIFRVLAWQAKTTNLKAPNKLSSSHQNLRVLQ